MALIRITVGPVSEQGMDVLRWSVQNFKALYPECDVCVCFNQIGSGSLSKLNVPLVKQEDYIHSLPYPPLDDYQVAWKIYPPRLRPDEHEVIVDNDILVFKRIKELDDFLKSDSVLLYQGLNEGRCGQYQDLVPSGIRINSGIFGMPPGFDPEFESIIRPWNNYYDEQGLVAAALLRHPRYQILPLTKVPIVQVGWSIKDFLRNEQICGIHFAGVNIQYHPKFDWFQKQRLCLM